MATTRETYFKVRERLLRQARTLEKKGFVGAKEKVPEIPKNIKKESIDRLLKYAENDYRKLKEGLKTSEGKTVREIEYEARKARTQKGQRTKKYRKYEREKEAQKAYHYNYFNDTMPQIDYASIVINNFMHDMGVYNDAFYRTMESYIKHLTDQYGEAKVAKMIQDATASGVEPQYSDRYDEEKVLAFTQRMFEYLPADDETKEEIQKSFVSEVLKESAPEFDKMREDYKTATRAARRAYYSDWKKRNR